MSLDAIHWDNDIDRDSRALDAAIKSGNVEETRALLGDDPRAGLLIRSLCRCCEDGQTSVACYLLTAYASIFINTSEGIIVDKQGKTPLMLALESGALDIVDALLTKKIAPWHRNMNAQDHEGMTALMYHQPHRTAERLVQLGADIKMRDNRGQSVLMWTLQLNDSCEFAESLIELGAAELIADDEMRTPLMTAIWKNRLPIIQKLVDLDNVNRVDGRNRNALHHLAIDKERADRGDHASDLKILETLMRAGVDINAKDMLGRTGLAAALTSGNSAIAKALMGRRSRPYVDFNAMTTAGWSLLHIACECETTPVEIIDTLLSRREININERTSRSRKTPLHLAAQSGNIPVIEYLLSKSSINRSLRDAHGQTPLLCAAGCEEKKRAHIGKLFSPWCSHVLAASEMGLNASRVQSTAQIWPATVIDFEPNDPDACIFKEHKIHDLIHKPKGDGSDKPFLSTLPAKTFRWIHLPANNITWCRDLITKVFIEKGYSDTHGFRALEKSLNNEQRGHSYHLHSRYMTPMCHAVSAPSSNRHSSLGNHPSRSNTMEFLDDEPLGVPLKSHGSADGEIESHSTELFEKTLTLPTDSEEAAAPSHRYTLFDPNIPSSTAPGRDNDDCVGHVFIFMPYLHHERYEQMIEMTMELERKFPQGTKRIVTLKEERRRKREKLPPWKPSDRAEFHRPSFDAHLDPGNLTLHIRRTLDQFIYHNIDTSVRDTDQVIYRYQKKSPGPRTIQKILMVDQFWMWIVDKDTVITSFPQCWNGSKDDSSDMLEIIKELVFAEKINDVYHLAVLIANCFYGTHEGQSVGNDQIPEEKAVLEMFSAEIGDAMNREVRYFNRFERYARDARYDRKQKAAATERFNKILLDIKKETKLMREVKDIRDELNMLRQLLLSQAEVLPNFMNAIGRTSLRDGTRPMTQAMISKILAEQTRKIDGPLEFIDMMDKQAERIYKSVRDLLDLKQNHVNAVEARWARQQADDASRQSKTITVFTIVTVIFLPLSFIAAFFAIPMGAFKRYSNDDGLSIRFVSEWIFGLGIPVALLCVLAALLVGPLALKVRNLLTRGYRSSFRRRSQLAADETGDEVDDEDKDEDEDDTARSSDEEDSNRKSIQDCHTEKRDKRWLGKILRRQRREDSSNHDKEK